MRCDTFLNELKGGGCYFFLIKLKSLLQVLIVLLSHAPLGNVPGWLGSTFVSVKTTIIYLKRVFWIVFVALIQKKFWRTFFFFLLFMAPPAAHGCSQTRGLIGATATSLHHSHSNTRSELCLRPTPQLTANLDL